MTLGAWLEDERARRMRSASVIRQSAWAKFAQSLKQKAQNLHSDLDKSRRKETSFPCVWVKPSKFAKHHDVTERTVWRWIADKKITIKKVGQTTLVWAGAEDPSNQLERIEKTTLDILHELRKEDPSH